MKRFLFITLNLLLILSSFSCNLRKEETYRKSEFLMDTIVTITVVSDSEKKAGDAMDKAFAEIKRLGQLLNSFSPDSEISAINRNAGISPVKISPDTYTLLEKGIEVSTETGGAFDMTVGVVVNLYDFHKKTHPSDALIREKLPLVNFRDLILNKDKRTAFLKRKGMSVDAGGIAKGYAADRATAVLKSAGIKAALVAVAGDIRAYGLKPGETPWRVGIRNPRGKGMDDIIATLELRDMAISTSGDYERFFIENGKRYHHLIDPKTGYPAGGVMSVTVVGPLAVYTDSLATALFISGIEKGLKIAGTLGYDTLMIDKAGKIHMTDSLKNKITLQPRIKTNKDK
ncbi:MAG TPA: FAD:protein FMN transferase [Nitrospirae bacterium]|nr:FAD:protein FMN transferase [Nitrospirota bacterium]